ncbi:MAG TPA: hypothetical protein VIS72_05255 [Anaerolineales bacterium]
MKNTSTLLFRSMLLLVVAVSFAAFTHSPAVRADGTEIPYPQEQARESVASCDNQTYNVPLIPEKPGSEEHFAISPNADGPVLADMGLYIEEIPEVNEIANTFTVEGRMDLVWCDPRLKYVDQGQGAFEIFLEEHAQEKLNSIWWPDVTFVNEVEGRDIANEELIIHENGTVEYREKFTVILEAKYDLYKFPFDKQTLEIEIESFAWDERYLQLHKHLVGFSDEYEIPEWRTDSLETRIEDVIEVGDRNPFSEFRMTINVTRQFGFYIWKVLFPLIILVIMCFAVFWMDDEGLSSRLGVGFTGVLTVVAYQFIATGNLPKVPYITLMDSYITLSFVVMVLTIFQSILVSDYNKQDKKERAWKIDKASRYIFPLFYVIGIGLLTIVFMLRG